MKKNLSLLNYALIFALLFSFENGSAQNPNVTGAGSWKLGGNNLAGGEVLGSKNNFPLNIVTDNIQRMIVEGSPDGFVGIGNNFPSAQLHVNSATGNDGLRVQVAGLTKLYVNSGGGVSVGSSAIPPANGLYVSGNAGIGTTAPAVKLHVVGGSDVSLGGGGFIIAGPITGANLAMDDNEIMARNNGVGATLFLNNDGGDLNVSAGALIVDASTNNVGIGITSPTSKLHVVGNIFATGDIDVSGTVGFGSVETFSDGGSNTIQSNSDITPDFDGGHNLGTTARTWASVHAVGYFNAPMPNVKVENLKAGINEIMKLRPVSYIDSRVGDMQRFGLVEKEVQQVLPAVTRDWEIGGNEATEKGVKKSVNVSLEYDAIIPVLIKGMQEQQNTIITLEEKIASLEAALNSSGRNQLKSGSNVLTGAVLEQNQPNPFNQSTIIRYSLPQGTSGQINIYDAGGVLVKTLKANGSGQATISANDLNAGTYSYALMVNGKMAASKKLVLIK